MSRDGSQLAALGAGVSEETFDLNAFSAENRARCEAPTGFNHPMDSWSLSDWMTATLGELGEAANVAKKLNRVRDGVRGNKETEEELRAKLGSEIADAFIYLDLLAQSQGLRLAEIVRRTFDAKSAQIGYVASPALLDRCLSASSENEKHPDCCGAPGNCGYVLCPHIPKRDGGSGPDPASPSVFPIAEAPELMPCPFCGGAPSEISPSPTLHNWAFSVECVDCGAMVRVDASTHAEAIAAWNRRAPASVAQRSDDSPSVVTSLRRDPHPGEQGAQPSGVEQ